MQFILDSNILFFHTEIYILYKRTNTHNYFNLYILYIAIFIYSLYIIRGEKKYFGEKVTT